MLSWNGFKTVLFSTKALFKERSMLVWALTLFWFKLKQTGIVHIMHINLYAYNFLKIDLKKSMWMGLKQWLANNNNGHTIHPKDEFNHFVIDYDLHFFLCKILQETMIIFSCINIKILFPEKNLEKRVRDTYICIPRGK